MERLQWTQFGQIDKIGQEAHRPETNWRWMTQTLKPFHCWLDVWLVLSTFDWTLGWPLGLLIVPLESFGPIFSRQKHEVKSPLSYLHWNIIQNPDSGRSQGPRPGNPGPCPFPMVRAAPRSQVHVTLTCHVSHVSSSGTKDQEKTVPVDTLQWAASTHKPLSQTIWLWFGLDFWLALSLFDWN